MNLRPLKFSIVVHLVEEDDNGEFVGERTSDPYVIYGYKSFTEFAKNFEKDLKAALNASGG